MAESSPLAHSPTLMSAPEKDVAAGERLVPGSDVGEYVVERFLGAGAMGEVYAGVQPVIGKKVAIKVLKAEVAASKDGAERFKREARAVNQIDHPNVIDIFSFGRLDDGRLYLVMDLVEGRSLRKAIAEGPLAAPEALEILEQIASALDAAHARGVVHRDLKPDNVMLGADGKVHVLDFGLAKLLSLDDSAPPASMLTGQGTWLGTPGYMAPEQWSADGAGPASDRYSLGVIAFELLSGSLPFQAATLPQMMEQHFRAKVPALSSKGAVAASSVFDPIVTRALSKDPTARFPTGRAMVDALREVAGGSAKRPAAARGRRAWMPAAAGIGVLGLSIAAVIWVRGDKDHDAPNRANASAPATAGMVRVHVDSVPADAGVYRDGKLVGTTPAALDTPAGAALSFEIKKAGYATAHHAMTATEDISLPAFTLMAITGFEGVWQLPTKELRAFKRAGERIEVSKLDAVTGPRQFFRHYELVPSDGGVAFGTTEELVDPRAPADPACHIPHKVEYQYDPQTDALVLRRERVSVDFKDGHCVVVSSELGTAEPLTRVDRGPGDTRETLPPAGLPQKPIANDSLDNTLDRGQKDATSQVLPSDKTIDQGKLDSIDAKKSKAAPKKKPGKPVSVKIPTKLDAQVQKQAPPPPPAQVQNAPSAPAQQPQSLPNNAKPRGDSQMAPQQAVPQAQFQQPIQKK